MKWIELALDLLARRVAAMIVRGDVRFVANDVGLQRLGVGLLAGEELDLPRYQNYGFSSVPLPGATAVVLSANGVRDGAMAVAVEDQRYRPTGGAGGDAYVYDFEGQQVHLTRSGIVVKGKNIRFETEGVFRVDADKIELHAATVFQQDVQGYGTRTEWTGDVAYTVDAYSIGATVTGDTLDISPPALDSDHPDIGEE